MSVVIITGSAGLIGSEAVEFFCKKKYDVIGIDNNLRKKFFGEDASTEWNRQRLEKNIVTDNQKIFESLGWKPKREAKIIFEDLFKWVKDNESALSLIA